MAASLELSPQIRHYTVKCNKSHQSLISITDSGSNFNFKLVNEFNEPIYDAPDFLLQLQITIYDKDNTYFKEASLQMLKLLNDIYFTVLNIVSLLIKK